MLCHKTQEVWLKAEDMAELLWPRSAKQNNKSKTQQQIQLQNKKSESKTTNKKTQRQIYKPEKVNGIVTADWTTPGHLD